MRYERAIELLRLAFMLQGANEGVSLQDIEAELSVSRRTAERLRDALLDLFPQVEELADVDARRKRWRLPDGTLSRLAGVSPGELAALGVAENLLRRDNMVPHADMVHAFLAKAKASLKPRERSRIEPDLEGLMEAEGIALRPGPRPSIPAETLDTLRQAVLACHNVSFDYRARTTGEKSNQTVSPYGFLYGSRHYLVAWSDYAADYRLFSLSRISQVQMLNMPFERDRHFSLDGYIADAFGVFREAPFDVVWKFSPDVAEDAREFLFHPSQSVETDPDGFLIVRFRAGGLQEMRWHLHTWGGSVEVLEPPDFWDRDV